jgi:hypothetical protein
MPFIIAAVALIAILIGFILVDSFLEAGKQNTDEVVSSEDEDRAADDKTVWGWLAENKSRLPKQRSDESDYDFRYTYGDAAKSLMEADGVVLRVKSLNEFLYLSRVR